MEDFVIENMAIEIIDTYENERVLIEELAQADSLLLNFDGGDDLYQPLMTSELKFSMAVTDGSDGKFKHLLTGDEKRFKVQLLNIDNEDNELLIWQGYILPDLHGEPFKNGVFFVEFTAIDMIASLKGKYLEPWFYQNKFNIPDLLGYIFEQTGLSQEIIVKPLLTNISAEDYEWRNLNMSLKPYITKDGYTDLYDILQDILTALGMQLCSYRGYWILQGLTRRGEFNGPAEVYNPDGTFSETISLENKVIAPVFTVEPYVTSDTPWKKVKLNFETEETPNAYPDDIVVRDFFATRFYDEDFVLPSYVTELTGYWLKQNAWFVVLRTGLPYLRYQHFPGYPYSVYNVPEAAALNHYIYCTYRPYVYAGRSYELEIEALVYFQVTFYGDIQQRIETGVFDKMFTFQVLLNGVEIMSNRPSFPSASKYRFEKVWYPLDAAETPGAAAAATWKLKVPFKPSSSGIIDFRLLPPIDTLSENSIVDYYVEPKVLRINVPDKKENSENATAVRDINYTKEMGFDLSLTCSVDSSVIKSLGIAPRIGVKFQTIPVSSLTLDIDSQTYLPGTDINMLLYTFPVAELVQQLIFISFGTKVVFLEKASGEKLEYYSLYTQTIEGMPYIAIYTGYTADPFGEPEIPEDYEPLPLPEVGDTLKAMMCFFSVEDIAERALWKVFGFPDYTANTYVKALAYACHVVRANVGNSIEGTCTKNVFPLNLVQFKYEGLRQYIPTRMNNNLAKGTCDIVMKEVQKTILTDVSYE